jgi:hypothetical protein
MYPPTNKTCTFLQTWHVLSYKQDMYSSTNYRKVHFLFVGVYMSSLQEETCVVCRRVHVMFVGGYMSCLLELHIVLIGVYISCLQEGTTCTLLKTRHVPSYKLDMYTRTNKTCTLLQTRHVPSYKHNMYPSENKTCILLHTWRRRVHVMFVGGYMSCLLELHIVLIGVYISCLQEGTCLVCRRVHVLFVGKTCSLLQTTEDKYEPNMACMRIS